MLNISEKEYWKIFFLKKEDYVIALKNTNKIKIQ